jgi:hypothetical protein
MITVSGVSAAFTLIGALGGYWGWQYRVASHRGELMLRTDGPNLVGEILDENGAVVLPAFPVPPSDPIALREGAYQLRLSGSGLLSETWPIEIARGQLLQPNVQLEGRWMWPPRETRLEDMVETAIVTLGAGADLVTLAQAAETNDRREYVQRVQRLNGATGAPVWPRPLVLTETNLPPGIDLREWQRILWPSAVRIPHELSRLVTSAPDVDGDGTGDLVWASRQYPALVAVSGAIGKVLWVYRSRPELPAGTARTMESVEHAHPGALVGAPAVADVDGDGVADFLACYTSQGERYRMEGGASESTGAQSWVAAVSGRTGSELWRARVTGSWQQYANQSNALRKYDALCRPAISRVGGRSVLVLCLGSRLHGWVAASGEPAWAPQDLGFEPGFAPEAADLDGDGEGELLLAHELDPQGDTGQRTGDMELVAWSPRDESPRWRRAYQPVYPNHASSMDELVRPSIWTADLNGDGRMEVCLPSGQGSGWGDMERWAGLEMLDAATGQPRWSARLCEDRGGMPSFTVDQAVPGPDLDGDQVREFWVSWRGSDPASGKGSVFVAALSGVDGRTLWQWSQAVLGPALRMVWWQSGADGKPMLVVPVASGPGGQRMSYVLDASDLTKTAIKCWIKTMTALKYQDLLKTKAVHGQIRMAMAYLTRTIPAQLLQVLQGTRVVRHPHRH